MTRSELDPMLILCILNRQPKTQQRWCLVEVVFSSREITWRKHPQGFAGFSAIYGLLMLCFFRFFFFFSKVGLGKGYDKAEASSMGRRVYHLECSARMNYIAPPVFWTDQHYFTRWWFQLFWNFHPCLGKWSDLTSTFVWVGWFNHHHQHPPTIVHSQLKVYSRIPTKSASSSWSWWWRTIASWVGGANPNSVFYSGSLAAKDIRHLMLGS